MLWAFGKSLLITFAVAAVVGACMGLLFEKWSAGILVFILAVVAQFAISSLVGALADKKNKEAEFLAEQVVREAIDRKLPFDLNCAYCNKMNRVGISFYDENAFDCAECKQPNKVYIQFTTVRLTVPLTQKDAPGYVNMGDEDPGVSQSTINQPIRLNEK